MSSCGELSLYYNKEVGLPQGVTFSTASETKPLVVVFQLYAILIKLSRVNPEHVSISKIL